MSYIQMLFLGLSAIVTGSLIIRYLRKNNLDKNYKFFSTGLFGKKLLAYMLIILGLFLTVLSLMLLSGFIN